MPIISDRGLIIRRRSEARQEMISLQLRLQTLTTVDRRAEQADGDLMRWDERDWMESRLTELRAVIDEATAELQKGYMP